jgi:hypothetical protein
MATVCYHCTMRVMAPIAVAFSVVLAAAGCGPGAPDVDAATGPYRLEVQGDQQIGLHYGEERLLALRYFDDHDMPITGAEVRYRIFGNPNGSSLSGDRATTDGVGWAELRLTAGAAESAFRVAASADNAPDLDFDVSVSRFAFVEIDPLVAYTGAGMGRVATVRALLYDDRRCVKLPPAAAAPAALRAKSASGTSALLPFTQLLAVDYSIAGRAEDEGGHLVAYGCVDLGAAQLPPGGRIEVPLPLLQVAPSVVGPWDLTSTLPFKPAPTTDPWHALTACPRAPAQPLLDAIAVAVGGGPLADGIAAHRGPLDMAGCRPATAMNTASLDAQLQLLLTPNGAPALALGEVVGDLDAVVGQARLASRLELAAVAPRAAGPVELVATHTAGRVTLAGMKGAHSAEYDLNVQGFPILIAKGVGAKEDGSTIALEAHGFTVRLPVLWGRALGDVALKPRGLPPTTRGLLGAMVGAAERMVNGQKVTGCAAIEDLVCKATAVDPCAVAAACAAGLEAMATGLEAAFVAGSGVDLVLGGGMGMAVDGDGDLVAERMEGGSWDATVGVDGGRMVGVNGAWTGVVGK